MNFRLTANRSYYLSFDFQIQNMFNKHIKIGILEIMSLPSEFYTKMTMHRPTLGDDPERVGAMGPSLEQP